jgi:hypothetical protein
MRRILLSVVLGAAAAAVALAATPARADEFPDALEGRGYTIGKRTVFSPVVGASAGFTDNVFYDRGGKTPAGLLQLAVEAAIESQKRAAATIPDDAEDVTDDAEPARQKLQFSARAMAGYHEYLSGDSVVRSQRDLNGSFVGHLVAAPQGDVSFGADETFIRDTRPTNFYSAGGTNRIANTLALALDYQPVGRLMKGGVRWENQIDFFEDVDQRFANRMINAFHGTYEWKFFPYSKAYADVSYAMIDGFSNGGAAIAPIKAGTRPIRGGAGIATALTERFNVQAHVGWAYGSYRSGTSYNTPVAGIEFGYRYAPTGRFVVAYEWDHRDSLIGDFYRDHAFTAHVEHRIKRIDLTAAAEFRLRAYSGIPMTIGAPNRSDVLMAVDAKGQYLFRTWMAGVVEVRTELDRTDYRSMFGGTDDPSYTKTVVTAGVRAAF